MRLAAIDIGSNSIRQIVADVSPAGEIRVVDDMKASPRLGALRGRDGSLDTHAVHRAVETIARMTTLARQIGAERIEAVATSAVRDAPNGRMFAQRVKREAGIDVRVLDGAEEARLSWRSALAHFDLASGRSAVLDIGGGSLEIALSAGGVVEHLLSLPLGALRLTEDFLATKSGRREVKALRKHIRRALKTHIRARDWRGARVIGSGGTFTNLAAMVLARQETPAQSLHETRVSRADVEHLLFNMQSMTIAERMNIPGLNSDRADIIPAGLAVVAEVMARMDANQLVVSNFGIREGLLLETAMVTPTAALPGEARTRSLLQLADRCHYEAPHAHQVHDLALQLFDALGARIGCTPEDRQTLADAALLHDIGYHISYERHHKHAYYLISHAELLGMAPDEQMVLANVARYHRGAEPKKKHGNFAPLSLDERERVVRLAALLRVADGFDRGHVAAVEKLKVRVGGGVIRIRPYPRKAGDQMRLERWGASRKSGLLELVSGLRVEIAGGTEAIPVEGERVE
ncbi:MAG TPA: Ppx/GppA phosphatase family protein [Gemmatimonadaceae bacterium]|nr:Ppx/GppA phosphatase family protein [Gemmatimonadaceae bacterium]